MNGRCFHGTDGGCAYCRAIVIADEGPDPLTSGELALIPCHTGRAASSCGACAAAIEVGR